MTAAEGRCRRLPRRPTTRPAPWRRRWLDSLTEPQFASDRLKVGFLSRQRTVVRVEINGTPEVRESELPITAESMHHRQHVLDVVIVGALTADGFQVPEGLFVCARIER